ncbi:hypothetical protein [Streptomyces chryseus]
MPTAPPAESPSAQPPAPSPFAAGHLGAGEALVIVFAITAVTVLAVLERPIPTVLTVLAAAACLLLLPGRATRALLALVGGQR